MKLELTRSEVCRLMMACTGIKLDMIEEYKDENTSEDRKNVLEGSIEMWKRLHDEIERQLQEHDKKTN